MSQQSNLAQLIQNSISGDVNIYHRYLKEYAHDASLFEIEPEAIVYPKNVEDICKLVDLVKNAKDRKLSLTGRSGGTDMGGGAINDSIIVCFDRYFNNISKLQNKTVAVQPGVYYRDFELVTMKDNLLMPAYPASREICMIGGMVANNAGGEKSLIYGKTDRYVSQVKVVLRDSKEHTFMPLTEAELGKKIKQKDLEGKIYSQVYDLVRKNSELIKNSKPKVSKNSTGYNLWDVWDGKTFDITKLFVGSQGTLGLVTEATFELVEAKPLSGMVVIFLPTLDKLGQVINQILPLKPSSLESFDEHTLKFAFQFFFSFRKTLGWKKFVLLGLSFIPVLKHLLKYLPSLPKIIILCEFEGDNQTEIDHKIAKVRTLMNQQKIESQLAENKHQEEKFWIMRRESFNLLRKNVKRRHTAPFIDDLIVLPQTLPEFLPKLIEIMDRYELIYTVAGHVGDGNFHVIPLMDLKQKSEREKIPLVLREVTELVLHYGGSLSGEHNDGLIRGPFLPLMYQPEVFELFKQVKHIFDPDNIFNPHKKTDATWEYSKMHIRKHF